MLPIEQIRGEILEAVKEPGFCVLLSAPTGSGKSTRVPGMLLEAGWGEKGTIIVVQPRRLAARLLAAYVARQFPCRLGQEVGYTVRFDSQRSAATRILFVTDGILERRLTEDPELRGVSAVIFDEVHERRLSGDLCLARVLELQRSARPEIGVFVMSATLELDKLQGYLPQATVLRAEGRLFPVEVSYMPPVPVRNKFGYVQPPPVWEQCAAAVRQLVEQPESGDVLVFLPGVYEIRRTVEILEQVGWMHGRDVFALHGQLTPEAQARAVEHGSRPRVIVSTNIAETSLTIEGVRSVVDCGTAREARWDPLRGISTLHIVPISQAQAEQRAGRAGRLGPGRCIRLWSEAEQRRRSPFPAPEVHRADISQAYLNLLAWGCRGLGDIRRFPWPDAPTEAESARAWQLLEELGAADSQGITPTGRQMLRYPLPPVLARLLVAGEEYGCPAEMAAIAALLQGENIAMASGLHPSLRHDGDFTDFQAEWRALQTAVRLNYNPQECGKLGIMARAAREVAMAFRQMLDHRSAEPDFTAHRQGVVRGLLGSFPAHVAARNGTATGTARLCNRRGGSIEADSVARQCEVFLAAEMTEVGGKSVETRLSRCTGLTTADLITREDDVAVYDPARKRVLNHRRTLYRDLVLVEKETGDAAPEAAAPLLAEQVVRGNLRLEGWDGHVLQWINRLACLRTAMPELELPDFGEEDRLVAITMLCEGAVSYKEIQNRPVLPILGEWLSPWQRECLNKYAPKAIRLPNGREVKLLYREDGTPVFGLKCQLLFGVPHTPTIAEGRVKCLVEILAPNQRPYQITGDLASFWQNGYPQMKKDLAGRYPRHDWPPTAPDA
ncbi:MAG: ATP-dependent helicase HrpB [Akkermansiaceae bacterium]|nr:ATP-dependent helicase HrpB [Akkermansiaceae bacterium]